MPTARLGLTAFLARAAGDQAPYVGRVAVFRDLYGTRRDMIEPA